MSKQWRTLLGLLAVVAMLATGCASRAEEPAASGGDPSEGGGSASGTIEIDGSSTVAPLTDAI